MSNQLLSHPAVIDVGDPCIVEPLKAFRRGRLSLAGVLLLMLALSFSATAEAKGDKPSGPKRYKVDAEVSRRMLASPGAKTSVIVTLVPGAELPSEFTKYARKRKLNIINGQVLDLPNSVIRRLEARPEIFQVHHNRQIRGHNYRTSLTIGARAVHRGLGLTGAGIGVAVVDSGITSWHNDLTNRSTTTYPFGDQRVSAFVDFVNGRTIPYDDEGHGTHVAGIIAGNGHDSNGQKAGVAPDASLISLKVLDANGVGTISSIIDALDWILVNRLTYNIRVVNMSVGAKINESYLTDPLTRATKRVVDAGVVVVTAAGNRGKNASGQIQNGGITAPGNAPWAITVGASTTNGTLTRADDSVTSFSSRGPTYLDWSAKPDLVAPGQGTVSLSDPLSSFYLTKAQYLVNGASGTVGKPYLTLSGTSMAAPVVAGTVALMLQANPALTPNAVKAILQYTAEERSGVDALTQGGGFLNAIGAVRLSRFFATARPEDRVPIESLWSGTITWGNRRVSDGLLRPSANAFSLTTTWGAVRTSSNETVVLGTDCVGGDCDNIVWGTDCVGADCDNIVWGTDCVGADCDNIVWGTACGGTDCDNIVWGTSGADTAWNAPIDDNWDTPVEADNIVWGTDDNIVWGTHCEREGCGDNIVWGTGWADIIVVWGTDDDGNIVRGTIAAGQTTWSTEAIGTVRPLSWPSMLQRLTDAQIFSVLRGLPSPASQPATQPAVGPPVVEPPAI
jgi:serine protease AprX